MEIDRGGKFNYTSCGHPMANWQGHEKHPTGHKTSEADWGGHDPCYFTDRFQEYRRVKYGLLYFKNYINQDD